METSVQLSSVSKNSQRKTKQILKNENNMTQSKKVKRWFCVITVQKAQDSYERGEQIIARQEHLS